jgi:glycosyltransferase involved in cell wall biosynthesis
VKVSVLMAVYNAETTIAAAMESLLTQTYQNIEIIVIDDGCSDKTIGIINSFKDDRVMIITNPENMGQIKSLNRGIDYCTGELIARMDADDLSLPKRFELEVAAFMADSELAVVSTGAYKMYPDGSTKKIMLPPRYPDALRVISMYKSPLVHISVMMRSDLMRLDYKFNDDYLIATDWELWSRILKAGLKVKVLRERTVKFFVAESTYGSQNSNIKDEENISIIMQNVAQYTGSKITRGAAQAVLRLHYPLSPTLFGFIGDMQVWQKIMFNYRYISLTNFIHIYIYNLAFLFSKYFRSLLRRKA